LPPTLDRLGFSLQGDLDMSVFGFKKLYLHLKSKNKTPVHMILQEGIDNGTVSLDINRERIRMQDLQHDMNGYRSQCALCYVKNNSLSVK
jgi:C-terminal processing protease CtpA/Prc